MPLIEIQRIPGLPRENFSPECGTDFFLWLIKQNIHSDVKILRNGYELGDEEDISFILNDNDHIIIYDQPKSGDLVKTLLNPLEYLNPIKLTQKVFSSLRGKQPGVSTGQTKTSPNTSLKQQTNIARNGEARPDNYGQIRSFPDLIQESLEEYVGNIKYVTEYMNFGIGKYDVSSVRYSESNLGSLAGASYSIFQPGENIGSVTQPYPFDDVDGQEIPGPNQQGIVVESATTTSVTNSSYSGGQLLVKILKNSAFDYFVSLAFPHDVTFTVNVTYTTPSGNVTSNVTLSGSLVSATETNNGGTPPTQYWYTFIIENIQGANAGSVFNGTINPVYFSLSDNQARTIGPFFSPIPSSDIWINTRSGLAPDNATNWTVKIWKVDDNNLIIPGTTQSFGYFQTTPYGEITDTFYRTDKITPAGGYGRYAVSLTRNNNSNDGSKLEVESISAINFRSNVVYPLETIIRVTTRATENSSGRERKYNALITRHTITYNLSTGNIVNTIAPSRSFADAALHSWVVMAGLPASQLDLNSLYTISNSLEDPRLGYFDYTFDDEDVSIGERMQTICDAARVICYWDDGVLSFVRDERREHPSTVFNTRNMTSEQYSISYEMTLPGGFDSVEVQYRNPTTNKQAYVRYRISGNTILQGLGTKPRKISMMYVRNVYQATDRAILECKRLIHQRISMNVTAMSDAEWLNVGEMVQVVDMFDTNQQSGEVRARNADTFHTSEQIHFIGDMFVVVTDRMGNVTQKVRAYPVDGNKKAFMAAVPHVELAIWDGKNVQSASRYAIATSEELEKSKWIISSKTPGRDGKTAIALSEYSDDMYNYTNPAS